MHKSMSRGFIALLPASALFVAAANAHELAKSEVSIDSTGAIQTVNANGRTDTQGAFFQSLGTNGRSCSTCHLADQAITISPPRIRQRFAETRGRDPLFNAVDGANCGNAWTGDAAAHSLLLSHGLIALREPCPRLPNSL